MYRSTDRGAGGGAGHGSTHGGIFPSHYARGSAGKPAGPATAGVDVASGFADISSRLHSSSPGGTQRVVDGLAIARHLLDDPSVWQSVCLWTAHTRPAHMVSLLLCGSLDCRPVVGPPVATLPNGCA